MSPSCSSSTCPGASVAWRERSCRTPRLEQGLCCHARRGARHDDQPLSVLLAGLAGGRGAARDAEAHEPLREAPEQARAHLRRIKLDTYVGMGFSNLIALFIMLDHGGDPARGGITDIQTSAQAAEALRPIAGDVRLRAVRARHHRHRPAGRAGARRLGRLRGRPRPALADRPRPDARRRRAASTLILTVRDAARRGDRLLRHRPDPGAVLGGDGERRRRRCRSWR